MTLKRLKSRVVEDSGRGGMAMTLASMHEMNLISNIL